MRQRQSGAPVQSIRPTGYAPRRSHGLALVAVLWVVTLLTVMAGSFSLTIRREAGIAYNIVQATQARLSAEAGLRYTQLQLVHPDTRLRWHARAEPYRLTLAPAELEITVRDSAALIDLNQAPAELLTGLLRTAGGLDMQHSEVLSAHLLLWRGTQAASPLADARDYAAAGLDYAPRKAPFVSVAELQLVHGMSPELYRRLAPWLTVDSSRTHISPFSAPPEVLRALPGLSDNDIARYLEARAQSSEPTSGLSLLAPAANYVGGLTPSAYTVEITATLLSGVQTTLRASFTQDALSLNADFGALSSYDQRIY